MNKLKLLIVISLPLLLLSFSKAEAASCIITISGKSYDVTTLQNSHSGGNVFKCGTDMTALYNGKHGTGLNRMAPYLISTPTTTPKPVVTPKPVSTTPKVVSGAILGVSYKDLKNIPVGIATGTKDTDNDGLFDKLELALGYNPYKADSNNNGTADKAEVLKQKLRIDKKLIKRLEGKLVLQVGGEYSKGEIWLIKNGKKWLQDSESTRQQLKTEQKARLEPKKEEKPRREYEAEDEPEYEDD